jgi:hypothetical protein
MAPRHSQRILRPKIKTERHGATNDMSNEAQTLARIDGLDSQTDKSGRLL